MWFNRKMYRVIRADQPVGFQAKTWTEKESIIGTYTLLSASASDAVRNHQLFPEAKALIFCDLLYKDYVQTGDRLIDPDDNVFRVVSAPLVFENTLKHIEVAIEDVQNFTEIEEVS
jgi:hypothetical protein